MSNETEMSVRTICVGLPQQIEMHGRTVRTAIVKSAVAGPVLVDRNGVEGNKSAVHPDAIYLLSAKSLDYWNTRLNQDGAPWPDGHLGENFTVKGLDESTVRIGDRFRLGGTLEMTVLGPRVPCDKLAWRLGQRASFLQEFALSGMNGFYLRVDKPGIVAAGDRLTKLSCSSDAPFVSDISGLIWRGEGVTLDDLGAALALETLSETSRYALFMKRIRMDEQTRTASGKWADWRRFEIKAVVEEVPDVRSFILTPEDAGEVAGYRAGQFLSVHEPRLSDGSNSRTFSISDYTDDLSSYRITVKRSGPGTGTDQLFGLWKEGEKVDLRSPAGRFVPDRTALEPAALIAGGIGVTPLFSMAKAFADLGPSIPDIHIFACMRTSESAIFSEELQELCDSHPKLKLIRVHSQPAKDEQLGTDYEIAGRLTLDHIRQELADAHVVYTGTRIDIPWYFSRFYICGPEGFERKFKGELLAAGAMPERVLTESFQVGSPSGGIGVEEAKITFEKSGKTAIWKEGEHANLLEFAEHHGIDAPSSCRIGACQSCSARILSGETVYDGSPASLPEKDFALLCCSVPASKSVKIDL